MGKAIPKGDNPVQNKAKGGKVKGMHVVHEIKKGPGKECMMDSDSDGYKKGGKVKGKRK